MTYLKQLEYNEKFTTDEIEEYWDAFSVFDRDNDGVITTKELGTLLRYYTYSYAVNLFFIACKRIYKNDNYVQLQS